jgi:hypothetical protein
MMIFPGFGITLQLLLQHILEAVLSLLLMTGRHEERRCDELRRPDICVLNFRTIGWKGYIVLRIVSISTTLEVR